MEIFITSSLLTIINFSFQPKKSSSEFLKYDGWKSRWPRRLNIKNREFNMFTIKRGRSVVLMYEFETFDCGLIKGQSFSEYECDLTFIFFEMHIKREIHSHQNDQTLLNILQPYYFFKTCKTML